jgi:hypothetical protein
MEVSRPKRAYVLSNRVRKISEPRISPIRKNLFEQNNDGSMTLQYFCKLTKKKRHNIRNFVRYHHFEESVKKKLMEELDGVKPQDIGTFSVSQVYLSLRF